MVSIDRTWLLLGLTKPLPVRCCARKSDWLTGEPDSLQMGLFLVSVKGGNPGFFFYRTGPGTPVTAVNRSVANGFANLCSFPTFSTACPLAPPIPVLISTIYHLLAQLSYEKHFLSAMMRDRLGFGKIEMGETKKKLL